jgi:DNA-binding transcriptional regulator LsrR (DeoR family)
MPRIDELRLIARVARMYYEGDMRQSEIARQLDLSQTTVSRLLNRSRKRGLFEFQSTFLKVFTLNLKKYWSKSLDCVT